LVPGTPSDGTVGLYLIWQFGLKINGGVCNVEKKEKIMGKNKEIVKAPDNAIEPLKVDVIEEEDGSARCQVTITSPLALEQSSGCKKDSAGLGLLETAILTIACDATDCSEIEKQGNELMSLMAELQPQDGFEGMLISQMAVIHEQAMNCYRKASKYKSSSEMFINLQNQGIKSMRLYAQQLEALDKHRRKGNQKMIVEHVHVHKGGQAIVGNVNQEGGGVKNENRK
jgi:hypothetical protein